jgi:hypothetical protein
MLSVRYFLNDGSNEVIDVDVSEDELNQGKGRQREETIEHMLRETPHLKCYIPIPYPEGSTPKERSRIFEQRHYVTKSLPRMV